MAQDEIIKRLEEAIKKEGQRYFSLDEICKMIDDINPQAIRRAIKQLSKHGELKSLKVDLFLARKIYKNNNIDRGMNLFFVDIE
jgi:SOS-response transcriptional repressor LexA